MRSYNVGRILQGVGGMLGAGSRRGTSAGYGTRAPARGYGRRSGYGTPAGGGGLGRIVGRLLRG